MVKMAEEKRRGHEPCRIPGTSSRGRKSTLPERVQAKDWAQGGIDKWETSCLSGKVRGAINGVVNVGESKEAGRVKKKQKKAYFLRSADTLKDYACAGRDKPIGIKGAKDKNLNPGTEKRRGERRKQRWLCAATGELERRRL